MKIFHSCLPFVCASLEIYFVYNLDNKVPDIYHPRCLSSLFLNQIKYTILCNLISYCTLQFNAQISIVLEQNVSYFYATTNQVVWMYLQRGLIYIKFSPNWFITNVNKVFSERQRAIKSRLFFLASFISPPCESARVRMRCILYTR